MFTFKKTVKFTIHEKGMDRILSKTTLSYYVRHMSFKAPNYNNVAHLPQNLSEPQNPQLLNLTIKFCKFC